MGNQIRKKERHEVTEDEIKGINWSRESMVGKEMTIAEAKDWLRKINLPNNPNFFSHMTKGVNPPLVRVKRGIYVVNPKPIHIDRMKKVWQDYANCGKVKKMTITQTADIDNAIKLLKDNGYKVFKPIVEYKEV